TAPGPTCSSATASPISSTSSRAACRSASVPTAAAPKTASPRLTRSGPLRCLDGGTAHCSGAAVVAVDLDDPSFWPVQALEKNIVYSLSPRAITDVVVDGQEVVAQRRLCNVALDEIQARVRELTCDWHD